jgi:hypothetical protein
MDHPQVLIIAPGTVARRITSVSRVLLAGFDVSASLRFTGLLLVATIGCWLLSGDILGTRLPHSSHAQAMCSTPRRCHASVR